MASCRTVALACLLALAPVLGGCLSGSAPDPVCSVAAYPLFTLPLQGSEAGRSTDPGQAWDALVRVTPEDRVDLHAVEGIPDDALQELAPDGNLTRVQVPAGSVGTSSSVRVGWSDGRSCGRRGSANWHLEDPEQGEVAEPGKGVHVYTAGFWDNGTLFYTNMEEVDRSDWPRGGWYSFESGEPLPVYVYDEDPDERPPWWSARVPDAAPFAGGTELWNYYVTIPGFNEALKGLSDGTSRVVRMEPEQGYTRDGNEDHPLYGDALTFYIRIEEVVDRPCRTSAGDLCPVLG